MSEFKQAMEKYARYVVQQARSNLSKGKNNASKQLYNSLSYEGDTGWELEYIETDLSASGTLPVLATSFTTTLLS